MRRDRPHLYILDATGKPVPATNLLRWGEWFERANRTVEKDEIDGHFISTVFLGIDHNFLGEGPPILWETMVFDPDGKALDQIRYNSLDAARNGHKAAVDAFRRRHLRLVN
jgi:hypothetical protein